MGLSIYSLGPYWKALRLEAREGLYETVFLWAEDLCGMVGPLLKESPCLRSSVSPVIVSGASTFPTSFTALPRYKLRRKVASYTASSKTPCATTSKKAKSEGHLAVRAQVTLSGRGGRKAGLVASLAHTPFLARVWRVFLAGGAGSSSATISSTVSC